MERRCCVEAKSFVFTVVEGASVVRLEERRRNFSGLVLVGAQSVGWLVSTMESLLWYPGEKDFVRSFREGSKVLIVRRGGNVAGRFLEVAVYAVGDRRGIIYFPEGYEGRGWRKVVLELGKVGDFLKFSDRHGMSRLTSTPEKLRRAGDVNNEDSALLSMSFLLAKIECLPSWMFCAGVLIVWRWRRRCLIQWFR
jgi:hypothetical protein